MVQAIREFVTVEEGGVVRLRSQELSPGTRVELIVLFEDVPQQMRDGAETKTADWMKFVGSIDTGDPHGSDNERIDADLAREYGGEV